MTIIYSFVKLYDNVSHAEDLLRGRLFMNTIRSFKEYVDESGELRGDQYEGIVSLYQPSELGKISIGNQTISPSELAVPIIIRSNHLLNHNVFCIYSLNSGGHDTVCAKTLSSFRQTLELHNSCYGLGLYCVVILNVAEFVERCRTALDNLDIDYTMDLVEYYDENSLHGNFPPEKLGFQKRSLFAHQREWRIKINMNTVSPSPYVLEVGDLSDIAKLMKTSDFNEQLEITLPDGSRA